MSHLHPTMAATLWFAPPQSEDRRLGDYRKALDAMDWQFQFSDDHAVFQAGVRKYDRAIELQKAVDPTGEIWRQHPMAQRHGAPQPEVEA